MSQGLQTILTERYREGRISHGELADGLGLSRNQVDDVLRRRRVAEDLLTSKELAEQVAGLRRLLGPWSMARKTGLFVTGTLGVLQIATERGLIDLAQAVGALKQTTFRVSDQVLDGLLQRDADRRRQLSGGSDSGVHR